MKGCYATDAEIQDSFQNIKKHSMAGIQALNNFSFESDSLKSEQCGQVFMTGKVSKLWFCTRCVNVYQEFKSVEKRLDVGRHLTEQSGQKPVEFCARCNRWWCSINKFMICCNNRIDCSISQQSIFEGVWAFKKEKNLPDFLNEWGNLHKRYFYKEKKPETMQIPLMLHPKWSV